MKNLICFVGVSGSGKSTITKRLSDRYGYKTVWSMTTRAPRYEGEGEHTFVSPAEFDKVRNDLVAYTCINGCEYGVTSSMLEDSDLYVIDWIGVQELVRKYSGKHIRIVLLELSEGQAASRMRLRGDAEAAIEKRLSHDCGNFNVPHDVCDLVIDASRPLDDIVEEIHKAIEQWS